MGVCFAKDTSAVDFTGIGNLIGADDALLISDQNGKLLFSKNARKELIPASILKLLTSLTALHYLGEEYRFITECYTDDKNNLIIKGYGDPLLISEVIEKMAADFSAKLNPSGHPVLSFNDILIDDSYFDPANIPGSATSFEPYDASTSAVCANFNTVNFSRNKEGTYVSAEPQTPLLPFVINKIKRSGLDQGRILLSSEHGEIALYAGNLFRYFFQQQGFVFHGSVQLLQVQPLTKRLLYRFTSPYSLKEIIARLLRFSNNFMTNQILIACGAAVFGPPGSLEKGVRAEKDYAKEMLKLENLKIVEGSGIARDNRITAEMMMRVLEAFEPHRSLMRHREKEYYKTGTLKGVNTRAGFLEEEGERYRFVIMTNTPGKSSEKIVDRILQQLK